MPRLYTTPPHTGATPKALNYAAALTGGAKSNASASTAASTSTATAAPATAAAAAPVKVRESLPPSAGSYAVDTRSTSAPVSRGDGLNQCDGCGKTLFGSGQRSGGRKYCSNCFRSLGNTGTGPNWQPPKGGSGAAASPTAAGKKSYAAAASPKPAAAAQQKVKAVTAAGALDRPKPKNTAGHTECHYCEEAIVPGTNRAPVHDVGGEPYCDVCYKQMANSLADANEKATEIAYKLGGAGGGGGQSLSDHPNRSGGGSNAGFNASAFKGANASNISDGDLKSMFMANYRKNKAGGTATSASATQQSGGGGGAGPVCSSCNAANDSGSRFCAECGGPLS